MDFRFANLLCAPYRGGAFAFDDAHLLSPIGNRVQVVDLRSCRCRTLPVECLAPIRTLCISPCKKLLMLFDTDGRLVVVNLQRDSVLHHMKFKAPVACAKFSPDGKWVAVAVGTRLQIWRRPAMEKKLAPMCLHRTYNAVAEEMTCLDWTRDGFGVAVGGKDMTTRVFTVDPVEGYTPGVMGGHRGAIMGVFFVSEKMKRQSEVTGDERDKPIDLITVGAMGKISEWSYEREEPYNAQTSLLPSKRKADAETPLVDKMEIEARHEAVYVPVQGSQSLKTEHARTDWMFHRGRWLRCFHHTFELTGKTCVTDVDYHKETGLMVVGFSNGRFELVQFPGFHRRQILSVSQARLTTVRFSPTGEWIAVGCAKLGQLLVWDWRSETQVLKQQGHTLNVASIAFSPDGSRLVTGADDTKVKVFSMATGFCTVTFTEHLMPVTAVQFFPSGNAVVSASLDGTIRAFDLVRHRNFRTFAAPDPVQFSCLAVDPKGEFVAAGSQDSFQIFVWSIKTAKLLDILAAHEGPVSALAFNPVQPVLGSASWDNTVKLWDVFGTSKGSIETLIHGHDVTTFSFRPDGKELAAATLNGSLHFWDPFEGHETRLAMHCTVGLIFLPVGVIEGRRDIARGRFQTDRRVATPFSTEAMFTALAYSADGSLLFASGKSKYICIYDIDNQVLLQKIQTSRNKSLDGVLDILNSRNLTEAGAVDLIDDEDTDEEERNPLPPLMGMDDAYDLPGSSKIKKPIIQTRSLSLCPTGQRFAAATTEGVLVYSLDHTQLFDPIDLEEDVTPQAAMGYLMTGQFRNALIVALRLRDGVLIQQCLLTTPVDEISVVVRQLPSGYACQMLDALSDAFRRCPDVELLMHWAKNCCTVFGPKLMDAHPSMTASLKNLHQVINKLQSNLGNLVQSNISLMQYIQSASQQSTVSIEQELDIMKIDVE